MECREKTPDDELQKMPQTKARKFKPHLRLEPALLHWWQAFARKVDMLTITPLVTHLKQLHLLPGAASHSDEASHWT